MNTTPWTKRVFQASAVLALGITVVGCDVAPSGTEDSSTSADALSTNEKTAYEYFVGKGLKNYQAAAIVGNLIQESSVNPTIAQIGGGPGRGIAQWSVGGRWDHDGGDNVTWFAATHGESRWALKTQLDFTWYELTHFSGYGLSELKAAGNISAATIAFQDRFEGCGQCDQTNRIHFAEEVLAAFGGSSGSGGGGGTSADKCSEGNGFCTETLQCDNGHWIIRSDDPNACTTVKNVEESCNVGGGYCTATLQCDAGHWVPRSSDPAACTSGPG